MKVTNVRIRKFRSIEQLDFEAQSLTVLSGLNSSGKSNVLRAIRFALVPEYSAARMAKNIPLFTPGPNAMARVTLTFDEPSARIQNAFSLPAGRSWTYEVDVKRNGVAIFKVNGDRISAEARQGILDSVLIIFVPPIRDIAGQGLEPFKRMLSDAIKKARGGRSVTAASRDLRSAIMQKGRKLLQSGQFPEIGRLSVDLAEPDIERLLQNAEINVRNTHGTAALDSFGTGHQNQVVLALHRQLATGSGQSVIFQFEEPDNHMHMTAMRVIADDLIECSVGASQAFVTTHSPGLMNHFDLRSHVCLGLDDESKTVRRKFSPSLSDREYRAALSQFGLRPAEAMTARRVVVVEGATDVSLVRALYRHRFDRHPERDDVLVVPVSGKEQAARLALLLKDLGVDWLCLFDYDAALNESRPYFSSGLSSAASAGLVMAIDQVMPNLNTAVGRKSKPQKILEAMRDELTSGVRPTPGFAGSVVSNLVEKLGILSATARAALGPVIARRQHAKWRDPLIRSGIWLWSSTPEELLVEKPAALAAAESVLRANHALTSAFSTAPRLREAVIGKLHDLAATPEIHEAAVAAILTSGPLGTDQFRRFTDALGS